MKLKLAQFILNMIDDLLSIAIKGRGRLASYLYVRQHPTKIQAQELKRA